MAIVVNSAVLLLYIHKLPTTVGGIVADGEIVGIMLLLLCLLESLKLCLTGRPSMSRSNYFGCSLPDLLGPYPIMCCQMTLNMLSLSKLSQAYVSML